MTIDQQITRAAARVAVAWRNMEEDQALTWQAEVDRLMDLREAMFLQDEEHERVLRAAVRELVTTTELPEGAREMCLGSLYASPGANRAVIDDEISKATMVLKGHPDHSGVGRG